MRDAELIQLFQTLDAGIDVAEPDPTFADDLFRRLRTEARRSRPSRALLLAVVALLVTGVVGGAIVLGSVIDPSPGPSESPGGSDDAGDGGARWVPTGDLVNAERMGGSYGEGFTVTRLADGRVLLVGDLFVPDEAAAAVVEVFTAQSGGGTSGTWAAASAIGQPRRHHTATLLADGRVLITGGIASADLPPQITGVVLSSAEVYDPRTGQWSATASMESPRRHHTATLLPDGRVLVTGGAGVGVDLVGDLRPLDSVELYDPRSGRWFPAEPMPRGLAGHTATPLEDGRVLLVGGRATFDRGRSFADPFLFDPVTESWTQTAPLTSPVRNYHTATLLADGRVLVAGGGYPREDRAEIFDPATEGWTATGDMTRNRAGFGAALLPDGRVLAAGSSNGGFGGHETAELYDPNTGSWTPTVTMLSFRGWPGAVRLADGRVLVVAGWEGDDPWAEVYEPGAD